MPWLGPDESVRVGVYDVRRASPADAHAYSLADAQMVGDTYGYTMPPEFARDRMAEVDGLSAERTTLFAAALDAERRGEEPARRTWVAWEADEIVGIAVSTSRQQGWEDDLGVVPIEGVTYQLNHLYLRPRTHGSGLAQAMLDLALPDRMPAYLWIVGGNARAERFYVRNGFQLDPVRYECGPLWFHQPLFRMWRL